MKKFLLYVPLVAVLAIFGFFGKSHGDFFGINTAFGYGGGGGGGYTVVVPTLMSTSSITVVGGNTVTTRNISFLFNVSNATMVAISERPDFFDTSWRTYSVSENFTLSEGYGVKTVYVKFRSATGGETTNQVVTITYVEGVGTTFPPAQPGTTTTTIIPLSVFPVDGLTIKFRAGLTPAQRQSVTNLVNSGRMFNEIDAKNYAYAIGVSNWQQFVGKNPKTTTTIVPSVHIFTILLKEGDIGTEIRFLQQKLADLGYFNHAVTGYFGPVTKAAVIEFQKAKGIAPYPGYVGPATRAALNAE